MAETIAVLAEQADRTRVNSRVVKSKFSTEYFAKMAHLLLVVRDWLRHDYSAVLINQVQVIYFYGLVVIVLLCNAIVLSSAFVISSRLVRHTKFPGAKEPQSATKEASGYVLFQQRR